MPPEIHNVDWLERIFSKRLDDFAKFMDERDKRYTERFNAIENGAITGIAAEKARVDTAFNASQVAIQKSETAQKDYNDRTNELRGALDDSMKNKISRDEYESGHKSLTDKMEVGLENLRRDIAAFNTFREERAGVPNEITSLKVDVKSLMTFKDTQSGRASNEDIVRVQKSANNAIVFAIISTSIAALGTLLAIVSLVMRAFGL